MAPSRLTAKRQGVRAPRCAPTTLLATCVSLCAMHSAWAARWSFEAETAALATWTDNVSFEANDTKRDDTILELTPRLRVRGEGARFRVAGTLGATVLTYAQGERESAVRPEVDLLANLEAVERLFFVEAAARATQTYENPYAPRPEGASSFNTLTASQYRVSPYLQGTLAPNLRYLVRSDNTWTSEYSADVPRDDVYLGRHRVEVDRAPRPFGWTLQVERNETEYEDALQDVLFTESARLLASYAISPEFIVGLRGGYERNNYIATDNEGAVYGAGITWRPGERTELTAYGEHRYFGTGWRMTFNHRTPRIAWSLNTSREVGSYAQILLDLPPTANVAALLDAIFTTRFPDPVERARVVQEIISRQGLPASTSRAAAIYGERLSLITSHTASLAFIGVRSTLALSAFGLRTEDLLDTSAFPVTDSPETNNAQRGGTVALSHMLTTNMSLSASATSTRIRSLRSAVEDRSKQLSYTVQATRRLAARTSAVVGARHVDFQSNVRADARETAAFVGLTHTF